MYEPRPQLTYPPAWRVALAFVVVPGLAAFLYAAYEPAYAGLPSYWERVFATAKLNAIVGAYPTALVFGVPAYLAMRRRFRARAINCAIVGAALAAAPWALLVLLGPSADSASIGGRDTVIDGHYTAYGWLRNLGFVGQIAAMGAAGGTIFWIIAAAGWKQEIASDDAAQLSNA